MTSPYDRWAALADREATGEQLTLAEQTFLREHAEADPVASAEARLWEAFASLGGSCDELGDQALARAAVRAALSERGRASRVLRRRVLWAAGATAAAAAVALALPGVSRRPGIAAAVGASVVEYVGGEVTAAGKRVDKGARVAAGTEIEARSGPACIAVEPKIHACLAGGAKVRLSQVGGRERRIDLLRGRVAMALYPLPPEQQLSVVAAGVWSSAVGTAFTVELEPDGTVRTVVHEGKVAVRAEHGAEIIGAHKIGLSRGGDVRVDALASHEVTETAEWVALGSVAERSIEGAMAEVAALPARGALPEPEPTRAPAPSIGKVGSSSKQPTESVPAAPATPATLLAAARQALRDQRWSDAAGSSRELSTAFPEAPEAHTVLVPLANLELDRLGQAALALKHLDAYLATGGSLAVEARLTKIRAYRALGSESEEAAAIDEFLSAHPSSLEASKLRERREALRPR